MRLLEVILCLRAALNFAVTIALDTGCFVVSACRVASVRAAALGDRQRLTEQYCRKKCRDGVSRLRHAPAACARHTQSHCVLPGRILVTGVQKRYADKSFCVKSEFAG